MSDLEILIWIEKATVDWTVLILCCPTHFLSWFALHVEEEYKYSRNVNIQPTVASYSTIPTITARGGGQSCIPESYNN